MINSNGGIVLGAKILNPIFISYDNNSLPFNYPFFNTTACCETIGNYDTHSQRKHLMSTLCGFTLAEILQYYYWWH